MVKTKEELERYFKEYYSMIYRVAFSQLKNHADAEDITQEMFIKIIKSEDEFESAEHEKAWIIRAAINMCRDLLKSGWHKSFVGLDEVPEQEKAYYDNPYVKTDDILWQVLQLPEKFRNCIYLFYYEDNSIKEIAQILEMPENTVKTNLRRGRELLKKMLK
jgi:RNA polymerase sigma-70 factor (ECF subfamily)